MDGRKTIMLVTWIGLLVGSLCLCLALAVGRVVYRRRRRYAEQWHVLTDPVPRLLNGGLLLFSLVAMVGLVQCIRTAGDPRPGDVEVASTVGAARSAGAAAKKAAPRAQDPASLRAMIKRLRPLHAPLGPPEPGDWLQHHKEPGQTFDQYLKAHPTRPTGKRNALYIQPIGHFTPRQRQVLKLTAEFMSRYFCLPVKVANDLPLSEIPSRARRTHPSWGDHQILSTYVLDRVLKPRLPADAVSYLALTTSDLWPGRGWNFVFGQASLRDRVGVWSVYRNGEPEKSAAHFTEYLLRTLKTATHETGHMFYVWHCTKYDCNMCGSNSRSESDRRPLALCPECLAKVVWAAKCDPARRFTRLLQFSRKHGLKKAAGYYERALVAVKKDPG